MTDHDDIPTPKSSPAFSGVEPGKPFRPASAPTHNLCVKMKDKDSARFVQVGVAWENEKGQFSIRLNPGTVLGWRDLEEMTLTIFPAKNFER